jgi:predicted nucleic acid-binding protein
LRDRHRYERLDPATEWNRSPESGPSTSGLLNDFTYLEMRQSVFLRSADIFRALRKRGKTIRSPADCLIAACAIEETASLLEDDGNFHTIAQVTPLELFEA